MTRNYLLRKVFVKDSSATHTYMAYCIPVCILKLMCNTVAQVFCTYLLNQVNDCVKHCNVGTQKNQTQFAPYL